MEESKMNIEEELAKTRNERKRIEPLLDEMESSIKEMNRKITEFRREIRINYEELDEMEEIRRKKIDSKRELQGLMRVRWSQKRKRKGNKRSSI